MRFKVGCPVCGWMLMQVTPSTEIRIQCPHCESPLWMAIEENGVRVLAKDTGKREKEVSQGNTVTAS